MKHTITLAAATIALVAGAVSAQAGCVDPRNLKADALHTIPAFMVPGLKPSISLPPPPPGDAAHNVVGAWLVTYTAGSNPAGQALIQWHDDGTEWENINFPILGGNVCVGAWKSVDTLHVNRFHVGWLYTDGKLSGYFTETETDRVPHRNAYTGVSDTKVFDLDGNVLAEFNGTSSAVRIAP